MVEDIAELDPVVTSQARGLAGEDVNGMPRTEVATKLIDRSPPAFRREITIKQKCKHDGNIGVTGRANAAGLRLVSGSTPATTLGSVAGIALASGLVRSAGSVQVEDGVRVAGYARTAGNVCPVGLEPVSGHVGASAPVAAAEVVRVAGLGPVTDFVSGGELLVLLVNIQKDL
ncbi:hypothetical protein K461DRAFT_289311 [Myriangium duriaei CBS 260.36]|uniref:Uncharacterized protein n=1 Tax=Myriangium duriaei CBS 260.36 TaxID=1168546 RepID=A0A9P4JDD2_9PEZI|nr:hypothetical protein K461DRAFT_289311 [Myriangium duriaei CBS 260.36]